MQIKRVWATDLYGILNFDHIINNGINLLVGINGSGKTSIINIINWITSADIATLSSTQYKEIGIEFTQGTREKTIIKVTQQGRDLHINGSVGKKKLSPIHVDMAVPPRDLASNSRQREEMREHYAALGPEKTEIELWTLLQSGPKPLTISLDRRIKISNNSVILDEEGIENFTLNRSKILIGDPIKQVIKITREKYSQYQSELLKINETLKAKLITSSFSSRNNSTSAKTITVAKISAVEQKLLTRMNAWSTDSSDKTSVVNYFKKIHALIQANQNTNNSSIGAVLRNFLADDIYRISALSDALDEFESKTSTAFESINIYLRELNSFFEDSGKKIVFNETNNQLYFHLKDKIDELRSIELMSSRKRQILILLTYIAFTPIKTSMFIIDEPELSLHPKWQHQLLPSIDALMGKDTQMIIATHSPEIVGNYKSKCIEI